MVTNYNKPITYLEALSKAMRYCVYQERCQSEIRKKLYEWKLNKNEVENIITELIIQNYLNESRFAELYINGKFRIKKWGRKKIIYNLKLKNVSEQCIKNNIKKIEEKEYLSVLKQQIEKKETQLKTMEKKKIVNYLVQKGFETELIWQEINKKTNDK